MHTAEEIRIRQLYRDLVLRGKVRLSVDAARGLVGPDCAYHLYTRTVMRPRRSKKRGPGSPVTP